MAVSSTDFYVELKKLFPGLEDLGCVTKLTIKLEVDQPVQVDVTRWVTHPGGSFLNETETKRFNLTERK